MIRNPTNKRESESFSDLVSRAKAGEQDAFTRLYERTEQEIYRTIRSMVRTEEETLDIQQDTYVYAFQNLTQLSDPSKFRAWLHSIAVNRTRTILRKQTPVLFSELNAEEEFMPERADVSPETSPEISLERKETARLVREILNELSAGQRMLVGMYYYEQMPIGEIAKELEVNPGTVKTQLFRARKKIEASVKGLEEKGVKLYGLSPVPFLLSLLKRQEPKAEAARAVLTGSLINAELVTQSVAVHVGRSFFETIAGRIVLGAISATFIGVGILGYKWIKSHVEYGEVRPPETTLSVENLATENTAAESITTEPRSTESGHTEAEPEEQGNMAPSSQDPGAAVGHSSEEHSDPTKQTDQTEQEQTESGYVSKILGWSWLDGSDAVGSEWDVDLLKYLQEGRVLAVQVIGNERPSLVMDRYDILEIIQSTLYDETTFYSDTYGEITEYYWQLVPRAAGIVHVACTLNGETPCSMTVNIPEPGPRYVESYVVTEQSSCFLPKISDCHVGELFAFETYAWGNIAPEITTDNPDVVLLNPMSCYEEDWPNRLYVVESRIVGAGDANVYVSFNGEIQSTFFVHASYLTDPETASRIVEWKIGERQYDCELIQGQEETLYVKVEGQGVPTFFPSESCMLSVSSDYYSSSVSDNETRYWFKLQALQPGFCTLYGMINEEVVFFVDIEVISPSEDGDD